MAMQLMALLCWITMLNPDLLFMIARRHMMQTWMSSVVSPIFNLVECRMSLDIRGPSRSRLDVWLDFFRLLAVERMEPMFRVERFESETQLVLSSKEEDPPPPSIFIV